VDEVFEQRHGCRTPRTLKPARDRDNPADILWRFYVLHGRATYTNGPTVCNQAAHCAGPCSTVRVVTGFRALWGTAGTNKHTPKMTDVNLVCRIEGKQIAWAGE